QVRAKRRSQAREHGRRAKSDAPEQFHAGHPPVSGGRWLRYPRRLGGAVCGSVCWPACSVRVYLAAPSNDNDGGRDAHLTKAAPPATVWHAPGARRSAALNNERPAMKNSREDWNDGEV